MSRCEMFSGKKISALLFRSFLDLFFSDRLGCCLPIFCVIFGPRVGFEMRGDPLHYINSQFIVLCIYTYMRSVNKA